MTDEAESAEDSAAATAETKTTVSLGRAIETDPNYIDALNNLGNIYIVFRKPQSLPLTPSIFLPL